MKNLKSLFFGPRGQIAWPILILLLIAEAAALWAVYVEPDDIDLQIVVAIVFGALFLFLSKRAGVKRPFNDTKATQQRKHGLGWWFVIPGFILTYVSLRFIDSSSNVLFWIFVWGIAPYALFLNMRRPQQTR